MICRLLAAMVALLLSGGTARAAWLEASSDHFVIYADDSEKDVRRFSDQLERYHAAMTFATRGTREAPSPSNRVMVFVVKTGSEVRRLIGGDNKYVAGFYKSSAGRSIAVVSNIAAGGVKLDFSMITLLHEYAHHFLLSNSAFPQPRWLAEGSAEFYSSASFYPDGSVGIGQPAHHRAGELGYSLPVTVEDLLDPDAYARRGYKQHDQFYGKSWLLYHYLYWNNKARGVELREYFDLLMKGKPQREAALEAFGDFKTLDDELEAYLDKNRFSMLRIPAQALQVGSTSLRSLSAGEAAMMAVQVRSSVGVNEEQAKAVVADARRIAAQYPQDAAVQTTLAEAEHDAGEHSAAIAAADAAIRLDPRQVNAYVQKGYAMFRMAADAKDPDAAFRAARAPFIALNGIEQDHPLPLIWYYRSFTEMGDQPTPTAIEGLKRAVELAPFDESLRMTLVMQQLRDRDQAAARSNLMPIAYAPHGMGYAKLAQTMLARLDIEPNWDGRGLAVPEEAEAEPPE